VKLLAWCAALLLLVGVAVGLDDAAPDPGGARRAPGSSRPFDLGGVELASASNLQGFDDCDELLGYFREQASTGDLGLEMYGAEEDSAVAAESIDSGDEGGGPAPAPGEPEAPATTAAGAAGAAAADRAAADSDAEGGFSGTNLQEVDVDEPDTVKTDGEVIVAVAGAELHVIEPGGDGPRLLGTVPLPRDGSSELLLAGDRATVLTRTYGAMTEGPADDGEGRSMPSPIDGGGAPLTVLTTVELSDPTAPDIVETRTFEGDYVSARMTGTLARLVLRSSPSLGSPEPGVIERGELETWMEDAVAEAPLEAWLPSDDDGQVVACDAVARPEEPAGVGTTTVVTIDVASSLEPLDATAVVANAETVYASGERLYVATTNWGSACCGQGIPMPIDGGDGSTSSGVVSSVGPPELEPVTTDLHAFDITGPTTPYLGSGRVEGRLLNSFSLSEHEGVLRVATTLDSADGSSPSESAVVTLAEVDGALVERGRLAGLGTTEQIYAVRYQGDIGYVVTFRQTDPLYTINLSDPASPTLLGELKIPGFSAYLHPAEEGRIIGVGQDASEEGRVEGSQVSTFDVTDLAAPAEEDRISFPGAHSAVEYEHRAFLWWAKDRVAVVPMEIYPFEGVAEGSQRSEVQPFTGAVAVDVAEDGSLTERGRVSHQGHVGPEQYASINRSLVIGDTLYTLSEAGVLASDITTLADEGWLAL